MRRLKLPERLVSHEDTTYYLYNKQVLTKDEYLCLVKDIDRHKVRSLTSKTQALTRHGDWLYQTVPLKEKVREELKKYGIGLK